MQKDGLIHSQLSVFVARSSRIAPQDYFLAGPMLRPGHQKRPPKSALIFDSIKHHLDEHRVSGRIQTKLLFYDDSKRLFCYRLHWNTSSLLRFFCYTNCAGFRQQNRAILTQKIETFITPHVSKRLLWDSDATAVKRLHTSFEFCYLSKHTP